MSFTPAQLEDLAERYTAVWNAKAPEKVAAFRNSSGPSDKSETHFCENSKELA